MKLFLSIFVQADQALRLRVQLCKGTDGSLPAPDPAADAMSQCSYPQPEGSGERVARLRQTVPSISKDFSTPERCVWVFSGPQNK